MDFLTGFISRRLFFNKGVIKWLWSPIKTRLTSLKYHKIPMYFVEIVKTRRRCFKIPKSVRRCVQFVYCVLWGDSFHPVIWAKISLLSQNQMKKLQKKYICLLCQTKNRLQLGKRKKVLKQILKTASSFLFHENIPKTYKRYLSVKIHIKSFYIFRLVYFCFFCNFCKLAHKV